MPEVLQTLSAMNKGELDPIVSIPSMPGRFFRPNPSIPPALQAKYGFNPLDAGALLQTRDATRDWLVGVMFQSPRCRGASSDVRFIRESVSHSSTFQSPRCRGASSDRRRLTRARPPCSVFQSPRCRGASSDSGRYLTAWAVPKFNPRCQRSSRLAGRPATRSTSSPSFNPRCQRSSDAGCSLRQVPDKPFQSSMPGLLQQDVRLFVLADETFNPSCGALFRPAAEARAKN